MPDKKKIKTREANKIKYALCLFATKKVYIYFFFFFNTHSERLQNCFLSFFSFFSWCTFILVLFWLPRERAKRSFHFYFTRSFTLFRTSYIFPSLSDSFFLMLSLYFATLILWTLMMMMMRISSAYCTKVFM